MPTIKIPPRSYHKRAYAITGAFELKAKSFHQIRIQIFDNANFVLYRDGKKAKPLASFEAYSVQDIVSFDREWTIVFENTSEHPMIVTFSIIDHKELS